MTWRFDGTGPQLMLIIRWFLPYQFPIHKVQTVDPGKEQKTVEPPAVSLVKDDPEPPVPNPEDVELPLTAKEELGQTKESTLEPPEGDGLKEAVPVV